MTNLKFCKRKSERNKLKAKRQRKRTFSASSLRKDAGTWFGNVGESCQQRPQRTYTKGRKEEEKVELKDAAQWVSRMTQREIANKLVEQSEAHKAGRGRENVSQIYVYSLGNYVGVCVCVWWLRVNLEVWKFTRRPDTKNIAGSNIFHRTYAWTCTSSET